MQKDASYHKAAIQYNEDLADFAEALAEKLEHAEVARWSRAVSKQHKFHAGRHKKALAKLENTPRFEGDKSDEIEKDEPVGPEDVQLKSPELSVADEQAAFAAEMAAKEEQEVSA